MHRFVWLLTQRCSDLLDPVEREGLLGDLEERGLAGHTRGLWDAIALAGARQLWLWRGWRPWAALVALYLPTAALVGIADSIAGVLSRLPLDNHPVFTPMQLGLMLISVCLATALGAWSTGIALVSIARRATASVLPVLSLAASTGSGCLWSRGMGQKVGCLLAVAILVAIPGALGLYAHRKALSVRSAVIVAMLFAADVGFILSVEKHSDYGGSVATFLTYAVLLWPALAPLATANKR